jgi:hypothetical protein
VNDEIVDRLDLCSVLDVIMDEDYVLMPGVTVCIHTHTHTNVRKNILTQHTQTHTCTHTHMEEDYVIMPGVTVVLLF